MKHFLLGRERATLVVVDVQERLAAAMDQRQKVAENCLHLIEAAKLLGLPVLVTEQYPRGLGPTVKELRGALADAERVEKICFGCCDESGFVAVLTKTGRRQVILTGMEAHVCVLQTALGLLRDGYDVHLVKDAVCSRKKNDFTTGVELMRDAGAVVTSTEIVLFQLLQRAGTEEFKAISKRIK